MSFILRTKLSLMMFLQFMLVAAFWVQLSSYLDKMEIKGVMFSLIMSTMAIGSIFSPLMGMFADRVASAEKVLFVLNVAVAVFLGAAYVTTSPTLIFVWLVLAMCAYMPTWGLTATIAMANSTPEAFPYIRVFGSLGWVCAAVFALAAKWMFDVVIDGTAIPLACGAGVAAVAAVFALFLPVTPPKSKGESMSITEALGLKAFVMLKDTNIAIFMASVVVWTVAFTIYWMYASFLSTLNIENITPTLNVGQISELLFMVLVPISIKFLGFKKTMGLGIFAMLLRYLLSAFAPEINGLYWGAIAVHGIIFGFFFVVAQMYIDIKAPADIKAQAQGLFFFFYGIAQILGTFFSTWLIETNTVTLSVESVTATVDAVKQVAATGTAVDWKTIFLVESGISAVLLVAFMLFFKDDAKSAQ
ncbi:nucleoside transporter [Coraliomargarita sp. CAG:312]|nr:nucleoside transporter [Coraliomargarita sp. CAG:312]